VEGNQESQTIATSTFGAESIGTELSDIMAFPLEVACKGTSYHSERSFFEDCIERHSKNLDY